MLSQDNQPGSGVDPSLSAVTGNLSSSTEPLADLPRGSSAVLRTAIDRLAALLWKPAAHRAAEPASSLPSTQSAPPAAPSADPADAPRRAAPVDAASPITACLKANTACLIACPRGDYNVEFLCSNRCRTKFQQCKGKSTLQTPAQPASGSAAPPPAN